MLGLLKSLLTLSAEDSTAETFGHGCWRLEQGSSGVCPACWTFVNVVG